MLRLESAKARLLAARQTERAEQTATQADITEVVSRDSTVSSEQERMERVEGLYSVYASYRSLEEPQVRAMSMTSVEVTATCHTPPIDSRRSSD